MSLVEFSPETSASEPVPETEPRSWDVERAAGLLYFGAVAVGLATLMQRGVERPTDFLVMASIPTFTAFLTLVCGYSLPGLFPRRRLTFPLNLTLPIIFCAFSIALCLLLMDAVKGSALVVANPGLMPSMIWLEPGIQVKVLVVQLVALSIALKPMARAQR
jgi:hypothetical protein